MSRYFFQPVGAPARSAIGRAIAGAVTGTADTYFRRQDEKEERERLEREAGIIPQAEIKRQRVVVDDPDEPDPIALVNVPRPPSAISQAQGGYTSSSAVGGYPLAVPERAPTGRPVKMAGKVQQKEVATEDFVDLGDGKAYVPGRDRALQVGRARAAQEAEAKAAADARKFAMLVPAVERVRSGRGTVQDTLMLASAGLKEEEVMDPRSKLNQRLEQIKAEVEARMGAEEPFRQRRTEMEGKEWDRRQGVEDRQWNQREATQTQNQRDLAAYRDSLEDEGGGSGGRTINYKTNMRTAPVYGAALGHALTGFNRIQNGRVIGTRPATLGEIVELLGQSTAGSRLSMAERVAVASQALRDARGQADDEDTGMAGPLQQINPEAAASMRSNR